MKYTLKKVTEKPFLYSKNNIITKVNNEFINLSGYSENELIGKSLTELSCMLRIDSQIYLENIEDEHDCYIFTKELEPKEVTISCKRLQVENEKVYFIKERLNSRIEEECMYLEQICKDNEIGISLYSFPDLIMLKTNQKHLDFWDYPYNKKENSIGKKIKETLTGYEESNVEKHFFNVIKTGKSYYGTEVKYNNLKRGVTYWDASIVPLQIEGKVKYIVQTLVDVTEKVVNRKLLDKQAKVIKEQKEELEAIIENMSDGVFICDKEGENSIIANANIRKGYPPEGLNEINDIHVNHKYFDMLGNELAAENVPIIRALNGEKVKNEKQQPA